MVYADKRMTSDNAKETRSDTVTKDAIFAIWKGP